MSLGELEPFLFGVFLFLLPFGRPRLPDLLGEREVFLVDPLGRPRSRRGVGGGTDIKARVKSSESLSSQDEMSDILTIFIF